MNIRTIHIKTDPELVVTNGEHAEKGLLATIGYFTTWAIHSPHYSVLRLFVDRVGDIHATYSDASGATTYTMFGQRAPNGSYSTHS